MKLRKYLLCAAVFMAAAALTSCLGKTNRETIYKSQNVEVRLADDETEQNITEYQWIPLDEETIAETNTVILKGTASNVRQAEVSYRFKDADVTDSITLFDIKIEKVISSRSASFPAKDTVTIGVGYNMSNYSFELPLIREGANYLLFCYEAADAENDPMELAGYVDCWLPYPKDLLCENIGGSYLVYDFFAKETLQQTTGLTELDIEELSKIDPEDAAAIDSFAEEHCRFAEGADPAVICKALRALRERSASEAALRTLLEHASVLDETIFESMIINMTK